MRQRLDHLEALVKRLISERQQASSLRKNSADRTEDFKAEAEPSDAHEVAGDGKTVVDGIRSMYLSGDDWHIVLQEINELKRTWLDDSIDYSLPPAFSHTVDGSSLLFHQVGQIDHMEILSTLPPKLEVDRLVHTFFDRQTFPITVPPILHKPTFMREYEDHWKDPSKTNLIWLGLLFSILGITVLAHYQYGGPPEYEGISESLFQLYRMRTAQCLLSGDISKCLPYTVETLRFNATAELNRKDDNRRGLWIMTGVVVRAAINMGYHLDPSDSPEFSLLQAEYRRRTWLSIIRMDDMASFLGGFPRLGSAIPSTTREPLNLHDWELSEKTMILPPSRPLTEPTAATYLIVKGRLFYALGRVADLNSIPSLASYETVLDVDRAVHSAYQNVPPHMKEFSISGDNSGPIRGRTQFSHLGLLCMYHKGMCVLHRKFLAKDRGNDRFKVSRDRCISSALALLDLQIELQPSFYKISQTRQMLTLAAMILFLELELRRKSPNLEASPDSGLLFHVLEQSCAHWAEAVSACDDTRRIHEFLEHMLSSFKPGRGTEPGCPEILPEAQLRSQRLSPWSSAADLGFSFEDNLSTMDFDWKSIPIPPKPSSEYDAESSKGFEMPALTSGPQLVGFQNLDNQFIGLARDY
ncbi:hypothetical protein J7T55_012770 [Diaporthe amygdali]|uniref:uncharacterized protein n=1 Tax=Phomopsis amygdali TaxID=1214568 RepID=UPI0022FDE24E|nr:uncharacterized protein J7T55_012770 [Diaporthe amygdali]KAJ0115490.1 hypothetical protein J7T55_012770 [Diaporthe amygdali]